MDEEHLFDSADVKRSEVFGNKFNLNVFNNVFSQQDTSNNGALVVSGHLAAMNESAYQEMGTTEIHNFEWRWLCRF